MAPKYHLTYFNIRGLGEGSRLLFAAAGVDYEDHRITPEQWPELKSTTPLAFLPMLTVDGVKICQSRAIERYLAKEFGLAGKSQIDQALVDMVIDTISEGVNGIWPIYRGDEAGKAERTKLYSEKQIPDLLDKLEKIAPDNGHFVGGELTWADTAMVQWVGWTDLISLKFPSLEKYPKLQKIIKNVEANPGIAAWYKKRPVTEM